MTDLYFTDVISCELVATEASDLGVVNAARISYDTQHEDLNQADKKLIGYLLHNRHGTPFEHGFFKFRIEVPIFAIREHHRHRIGHSYNEMSGRYTELAPKFYVPTQARVQEGKPGHYIYVEQEENHPLSLDLSLGVKRLYEASWKEYQHLLSLGIAKEQARMVLPLGIYTKMIWSCNPRSLMHFLSLRAFKTAQKEIRCVAELAEEAFMEAMPVTYDAFTGNDRIAP